MCVVSLASACKRAASLAARRHVSNSFCCCCASTLACSTRSCSSRFSLSERAFDCSRARRGAASRAAPRARLASLLVRAPRFAPRARASLLLVRAPRVSPRAHTSSSTCPHLVTHLSPSLWSTWLQHNRSPSCSVCPVSSSSPRCSRVPVFECSSVQVSPSFPPVLASLFPSLAASVPPVFNICVEATPTCHQATTAWLVLIKLCGGLRQTVFLATKCM